MLEKTRKVLETISKHLLFAEHEIRFVGGTALSYLINHRLSEDLDFAMLELCRDKIEEMMLSYGATKIEHDLTANEYAKNEGSDLDEYHLKYILDGVKVEFFSPSFNLLEKEIWESEQTSNYQDSNIKIASLKTILYMKTMAFWSRKKYRDLYDIYFALTNLEEYSTKEFLETYLKYNITYTTEMLYVKIKSKSEFYERSDDEGISLLVDDPKSYEWYRAKIEEMIYESYLEELYSL